jgi:hypothetical protein
MLSNPIFFPFGLVGDYTIHVYEQTYLVILSTTVKQLEPANDIPPTRPNFAHFFPTTPVARKKIHFFSLPV